MAIFVIKKGSSTEGWYTTWSHRRWIYVARRYGLQRIIWGCACRTSAKVGQFSGL